MALGERLRHVDPRDPEQLASLNDFRLTKVKVRLSTVLDCCSRRGRRRSCAASSVPGLTIQDLCASADLGGPDATPSQGFGAAAYEAGFEGLLVPSCTRFASGNIVIFPDNLKADATLSIVGSEEPSLIVAR